uniref:Putative dimethylglycine dehydrogenase n=2 Tax=Ixodes ricinus TaxID=34613 RepID=A0A6B0VGT1_IXORI
MAAMAGRSLLRLPAFPSCRAASSLPQEARVVVCGGGVVGCSVAYHLARDFGVTDVVVLEKDVIGGGSTRHGAGILSQIKATPLESRVCKYSIALYKELQGSNLETGWKQCGSLLLARTRERLFSFRRLAAMAAAFNLECELWSPAEAQRRAPNITTDCLEGALWVPGDGVADPSLVCQVLSSQAAEMGVHVVEGCSVEKTHRRGHSHLIHTSLGSIACEYFVNSAGYLGRHVGKMSQPEVKVPLYPCEHQFLHTMPVQGIDPDMPVIHDCDGHFYLRVRGGAYLAGGFEPRGKPVDLKDLGTLPEDWDQFYVLLKEMLFRVPSLANVQVDKLYNCPESFTADCRWIIGEAPEVKNYFVASGMKSVGIEAAGGLGQVTAEWIAKGEPNLDLWDIDIRRFIGTHNNGQFLRDRMTEAPGMHYKLCYPFAEFETGRDLRMSPIYPRLKLAGAVFGQTMGYERPHYYTSSDPFLTPGPDEAPPKVEVYGKPPWFDAVKSEYEACRERVALLDYSSFTKLEVWSPGGEVVDLLQHLCSNDVDIPVGSIVNSGMQNEWGGYENDCSLIRLEKNRYLIIAPTKQQMRCQTWIRRHVAPDSPIVVADVTSMYTAICIMGQWAPDLMAELTDSPLGAKDFPLFTWKELDIGLASGIKVCHMTHTGDRGWVLYIPNEYALHVYDRILQVGLKYGIQHAGYFAMKTLRIEKFFAFWGKDLDCTTTPFECGRAFRVKFDKDFVGREALLRQKEQGVRRRYVQLLLQDHDPDCDPWPWGREPILWEDRCVGFTSSTCYGFTLGGQVCLGFVENRDEKGVPQTVTNDFILKNEFTVDIGGHKFSARANIHSPSLAYKTTSPDRLYLATR